ncbi:MAG TPA: hypothetical protein VJ971_17080 [Methylomirabilota bacterium]|jgi:hypothetical protein|nr:hypothetical protein [Methylomirabilota bacterium]
MSILARIAFVVLLTGCASGPGLSSLGREAKVTPLRGQPVEQIRQDDAECERWTRATKGQDEPLPSADLRYAACAVARGYRVTTAYVTISSPTDRTLDTVLTEWRECRADKMELSADSYLVPFKGYADAYKGQKAVECLSGRGYVVVDVPRMVDRTDPMRSTR